MRFRILAIVLAAIALIFAALAGHHLAKLMHRRPAEREGLKSEAFDFGERRSGEIVQHTFRLSNPSAQTLHVTHIRSSCGCTVLKTDLKTLAPFTTVEIPVEVRLGNANASFAADVAISFQEREPIRLTVTGRVVEELPETLRFGEVLQGRPTTRRFVFRSFSTSSVTVLRADYDQRYLDVRYGPGGENARDVEFAVSLKPDLPFGPFDTTIQIRTDDPSDPIKRVTVQGRVANLVELRPAKLTMILDEKGMAEPVMLEMYSPYGRSIRLLSIEATPEGALSISAPSTARAGGTVSVFVRAVGKFPKGVTTGSLRIRAGIDAVEQEISGDWYVWAP